MAFTTGPTVLPYSLDQLEVLEAIAREGTFGAAARATHRSTPSVSYAIRSLEESLDVQLFDRSGHRARLTAGGELLLAEARHVLARARQLQQVARLLGAAWEPQLTVVLDGLLPMDKIMQAVRQLAELGAPTRIQVRVEYLSGVLHRFTHENADLMIALDLRPDPTWHALPLPPVGLRLVVHPDHALASLPGPIDRPHLAEHVELVVADSGPDARGRDHRLWVGSPHVFQVGDFHTKAQAVRGGVGFGWLPEHLIGDDLATGTLVPVPFVEGDHHAFVPHLVRRAELPRGRAARFFEQALLASLGSLAPA